MCEICILLHKLFTALSNMYDDDRITFFYATHCSEEMTIVINIEM